MPPPKNGNEHISFPKLMALEKIGGDVYRSTALAFGPANGVRAYGGHVYAQACYAAAQTVGKGFVLHNMTGWFLIAGKSNERFIYKVRRIRDSGFSTRGVDAYQESNPGCCFTCICSFKIPEKPSLRAVDVRQQLDLRKEYESALGGKQPHEHREMPGLDSPWYWEYSDKYGFNDPFPGLRLHKVNMDEWNQDKPPLERRSLKYYAARGDMPSISEDPNLHLCAHLYASDRNSLFVITNHLEIGNDYSAVASLAHTVIFHADASEVDMFGGTNPQGRWFCQESWAGGARQGRGLHETRLWRDDGLHIATTLQDGLVRLKSDGIKGKDGFSTEGMIGQLEAMRKEKESKL